MAWAAVPWADAGGKCYRRSSAAPKSAAPRRPRKLMVTNSGARKIMAVGPRRLRPTRAPGPGSLRRGAAGRLLRGRRLRRTAGRELQAGMQTGTVQPAGVKDATFAGAGRLHPAQGLDPFAAVVRGEEEIPDPQDRNRADNVYDKKASHRVFTQSSDADGTS